MSDKILDVMKLIATRSDTIGHEAAKTIMAMNTGTNVLQMRINLVCSGALQDRHVFSPEELEKIAGLIRIDNTDDYGDRVQVRCTVLEKEKMTKLAEDHDMTLSEWIRMRALSDN